MTSHHAVLLSTEVPLLFEFHTAPQVVYKEPQVGVDTVRRIIEEAYRRPTGDATEQLIMVATEFITEEAQQALLKIIEEPPLSTKFLFVIPHGYTLLATLESRFSRTHEESIYSETEAFGVFLERNVKERFLQIEQALKQKDIAWQTEIKRGLIGYVLQQERRLPIDTLKELDFVSRLLLTRGASNKFLLEHLALTLPA